MNYQIEIEMLVEIVTYSEIKTSKFSKTDFYDGAFKSEYTFCRYTHMHISAALKNPKKCKQV